MFGSVLKPKVAVGEVSFSGPDANGLVVWTFKNTGNNTGSWILQRGASEGGQQFEDYVFGQAFNVMYLYNESLFGTSLLIGSPTPLVDNGAPNNVAPMAIVDAPTGRSICFIFTLAPGQVWFMEEGGFTNGITPSNPRLIRVTVKDTPTLTHCDTYQSSQCQGYNQQVGTNYPCPPNPWQISSIEMQTDVAIPILTQDTITDGPCGSGSSGGSGGASECIAQIEAGLESGDLQEIMSGFECLIMSGVLFTQEDAVRVASMKSLDDIRSLVADIKKRL